MSYTVGLRPLDGQQVLCQAKAVPRIAQLHGAPQYSLLSWLSADPQSISSSTLLGRLTEKRLQCHCICAKPSPLGYLITGLSRPSRFGEWPECIPLLACAKSRPWLQRHRCSSLDDIPALTVDYDLDAPLLQQDERQKLDDQDDSLFYERPRFVLHTDEAFIEKLSALYKEHLTDGMGVLDLMSSWQSHLPESLSFRHVTGHGLNQAELLANNRLDDFVFQDLNTNQTLPFGDSSFEAVLCALSVQYLQYPEKVFAEVHRVLAPSGVFIISFSRHCFQEKAIAGWLNRSLHERVVLVTQLLRRAGFTQVISQAPPPAPPGEPRQVSDPFCAVIAAKTPLLVRGCPPEVEGYQYQSFASETLRDAGYGDAEAGEEASDRVVEMWVAAYQEMQSEAEGLGIPRRAIPVIQEPVTRRTIQEARDLLRGIIESRLSSNL